MHAHSIEAFESNPQHCIHIALNHLSTILTYATYIALNNLSPTRTYAAYIAFSHLSPTLGYAYTYHLHIWDQPSANRSHTFEPFESDP